MKNQKIFTVLYILSAFGILLSVYLLYQQAFRPAFQPCTINSWINCDAIIKGPVAKTLGIPTPLIGLTGYIVIFIAASLKKLKLLLGMAKFGLLFCLYLAYEELIVLRVICPICILCQLTMVSVFSLSVYLNREFIKKTIKKYSKKFISY